MNKRRATFLLFLIFVSCAFYSLSLQKVLFNIGQTYKLSGAQKGNLVSASSLGFVLATLTGGYLSEFLGKKPIIAIGSIFSVIGSFLFGYAPNIKLISPYHLSLFFIFLVGAGTGVMDGVTNALIVDLYPEKKSLYLNLSHAFFAIGAIIEPIIAGYLIKWFNWSWVYYFVAMFGLLILILFSFQKFPSFKDEQKLNVEIIRKIVSKRDFWGLNLCIALYVGAEIGFGSWLVEYLQVNNNFELSQMSAGMFLSYFWIAMLIGRFLYGFLVERFSYKTVLSFSSLGGALSSLGFIFVNHLYLAIAFVVLYGLFLSGMFATIISLGTEKFPRYSGVITGAMVASGGIGGAIFPNIIGRIADIEKWGLELGLGSCALYLLGIFIIILMITGGNLYGSKERSK
ncbi:MFS transporter [Candidatus Aerophobetes bacterium]|nr:MFS transporter [Candidatus Aerophobetes bacterium]